MNNVQLNLSFTSLLDPDEIRANRAGYVSQAQIQRLSNSRQWVSCVGAMIASIAVLLGVTWVLSPQSLAFVPAYYWILAGSTTVLYGLGIGIRAWRIQQAINDRRIVEADGSINEKGEPCVPNLKVWVPGGWHDLQPGKYHFYLLAEQNALLSAEKTQEL